ncbi:carboxypeptidase-like regulatory domain-containing protein [Aquimarina agarivorans]|uniref:carboxypeptidase-like regulatory domain-containing protein n=1 Tax=Aquimarina agarivorans TaxID=980584 RepID=UPI0002ED0C99|nr:carboxypeptidase-like regulatory domain-containing protein [Aquimarina agarivorans]
MKFSILGKVFDKTTNKPIKEAIITLNAENRFSKDIAQLTNELGEFKYYDLDQDTYVLTIIKEGYKQYKSINVSPIEAGVEEILVFL